MKAFLMFMVLFGIVSLAGCAQWGDSCDLDDDDCGLDLFCVDCGGGNGACGDDVGDDLACYENGSSYSSGSSNSYSNGTSNGSSASDYDKCNYAWSGIDDYQVESHCMAACAHKVAGMGDALRSECGILSQFDPSYPSFCSAC